MLKDIIEFVMSRTNLTRESSLREINYAWRETWKSDDLPDSLFEITMEPIDSNSRLSLPWYVYQLRGVKQNFLRMRIHLNTPRPFYQDDSYVQSPFVWRLLGTSPLIRSITNATTVNLSFTEPVTEEVIVSLIGPDDNGSNVREQITFAPNETTKRSTKRYTDFSTITKDKITETDLIVTDASSNELARVPNLDFEARNMVIQITDKCFVCANFCRCFDILYKKKVPYLYYDEQYVPDEEVIQAKTMEWILMPKDGQETKTQMFSEKARQLISQFNGDDRGTEFKIDLGLNKFTTQYRGKL